MAFISLVERTNPEKGKAVPIEWRGQHVDLPIYKVRYDTLRFNHRNGRIRPHLCEYCAGLDVDFEGFMNQDFSQESLQTKLRKILENEKAQRRDAMDKFRGGERLDYTKPLIVTHDGRVINGNQRLSIFSELVEEDPGKYGHLEFPFIAILPDDGQEVDYRKIEIRAQENELISTSFDWIQAGLSRRDEIEAGTFTLDELAALLGLSTSQLTGSIDLINTVDLYLESIGKPGMYQSEVREKQLEQAFKEVQTGMSILEKKPVTAAEKDAIIECFCDEAFTTMSTPDVADGLGGGVYGLVRDLVKSHDLNANEMVKLKSSKKRTDANRGSAILRRKKNEPGDGDKPTSGEDDAVQLPIERLPALKEGEEGRAFGQAIKDRRAVMEERADATRRKQYAKEQVPKFVSGLQRIEAEWEEMDTDGLRQHLSQAHEIIGRLLERGVE
jgi:hypothetical protein